MEIRWKNINFIILSFFLFLCPFVVNATSCNVSLSSNNSVYNGNNIDVTLIVSESGSNGNEGVSGIQGPISYDSSKLELVSTKSHNLNVNYNSGKIVGMVTDTSQYLRGSKNIITFTFKAKQVGNATISIKADVSDANGAKIFSNTVSKTITITNPPSSNNNLSSLSVSQGSLNFNKNTTNYNVSVDSSVTSININATSEDSDASISGIGNKNLNYGNNKFDITVTAPSGAKKTYTINVNRKDSRSSNNKLSSLSINGGSLSPKFNSNTDSYTISVPYSISSLNIDAKAEDSKAKVSISNNKLIAEETTAVKIIVTAENGSTKTYTINATRGKDPNKVLSTNNYLSDLTVSNGSLSPSFNKEQENYIVYLPYEIDSIKINTKVEDTKYATIKLEGPDKLSIGNNNYKITVTAEDNSTKIYTVVVSRGINMTGEAITSNTYLKSIKIKDGKLKETFNKEVYNYTYTGGLVEAIPEDGNSTVTIINHNNITSIIVKSVTGEIGIYTLTVNKSNSLNIILSLGCLILIASGVFIGYRIGKEKNNSNPLIKKINRNKKTKKEKVKNKKENSENV